MDQILINSVIQLSLSDDMLDKKREICHIFVSGKNETYNIYSKWFDGKVEKPQYMHSATSIYILIKYPHFRPNDSFVNLIIEAGTECENAWLKIATDILIGDPDGINFVKNSDNVFANNNKITLVDETRMRQQKY